MNGGGGVRKTSAAAAAHSSRSNGFVPGGLEHSTVVRNVFIRDCRMISIVELVGICPRLSNANDIGLFSRSVRARRVSHITLVKL